MGWVEEDVSTIQSTTDSIIGHELENLPSTTDDFGITIGSTDGDVMMADATATMPTIMLSQALLLPPPYFLPPKSKGKLQLLTKNTWRIFLQM